jgi:hypothetical protein
MVDRRLASRATSAAIMLPERATSARNFNLHTTIEVFEYLHLAVLVGVCLGFVK